LGNPPDSSAGRKVNDFDLRALIREVADASTVADPGVLVAEVSARIAPEDRGAALDQCLRSVVVVMLSQMRMFSHSPDGQRSDDTHGRPAAGGSPSHKGARIREHWRKALRDRMPVGDGEWKFLAECTGVDLDYAAGLREDHAARTLAHAEQLRRLGKLLVEHDADTVGDLPDDVLRGGLEGDA